MPVQPSSRMKRYATGRLVDRVTVQTVTPLIPTRAQMAAGAATLGTGVMFDCAVMTETLNDEAGTTMDRVVRDLLLWVHDVNGSIQAGDRVTFTRTRDVSLTDQTGTVLTVDRDSMRAVRRMMVRLGNDA